MAFYFCPEIFEEYKYSNNIVFRKLGKFVAQFFKFGAHLLLSVYDAKRRVQIATDGRQIYNQGQQG